MVAEEARGGGGAGLAVATAAASLATCAAIGAHRLLFGSVAGRWVYPYIRSYEVREVAVALGAAAASVLLVAAGLRLHRSSPASAVALVVAGATVLQLLVWSGYPFSPGSIIQSDAATSYFSAARRLDPLLLLRAYERIAPTLPLHAVGNMPGKILLFRAFHALTSSPDVMALLVLLLSNLVGVVLLGVARELLGDPEGAFGALALWLFVPARLAFAPILNGVTPLPVVLALLAWVRFLRSGRPWLAAATGAALFLGLLFDPTPFGLGLLFVAAALTAPAPGRLVRAAQGAAIAAGTLMAGWLAFRAATGFDLLGQLVRVAGEADRFNAWAGRSYATWLVPNLIEFLVSLGVPVVVAVAWGLTRARTFPQDTGLPPGRDLSSSPGPSVPSSWLAAPPAWLAATALATLAVLDLLGRNRGEVSRLWIFLCVPFVLAAAGFLAGRRGALLHAVAWMAIQGATMLAVLGFVIP